MSDNTSLDEFTESGEQGEETETSKKQDAFGCGSFGEPPEDWSVSRVEDLLEIRKNSADPNELDADELVRLYSMPAYDDGAIPELTKAKNIGSKKFIVPNKSLLFSKLNISKKRFWLVDHSHRESALCSTEYWPILPNEKVNLEFYLQYFNSDSFINRPRLSTSSTTNSHQRIKSNLFNKVRLPVPRLTEQRKIATVLHTVDQAIQKTEEIIGQIERLKKGVAQDLFRGGLNAEETKKTWLGEIPSDWDTVRFEELIESSRNGVYKKEDAYGGKTPILKMGDMFGEIIFEGSDMERLEMEEDEIYKYRLDEGDLLFARRSLNVEGAGECTLIGDLDETTVFESSLIRVRLESDVNPMFFAQYFEGPVGSKSIERIVTTTTASGIAGSDLKNLLVPKPDKEIQKEIANKLSLYDTKVEILEQEKRRFQRLKKGLMQDLLSGKVRTTDVDIDIPEEVAKYG